MYKFDEKCERAVGRKVEVEVERFCAVAPLQIHEGEPQKVTGGCLHSTSTASDVAEEDENYKDLVEVVESGVKVGHHAGGRFVGDLDGDLEDALRDGVSLAGGGRLRAHVDAVARVTLQTVLLDLLLQSRQPLGHQMYVLNDKRKTISPNHASVLS